MSKFRLYLFTCVLVLCITCFSNCAKRGYISGGPMDTLPPVVLKSYPENYSINFDKNEIKIEFDEFIKLKNANQNLIVSPPLKNNPDISPMGSPKKVMTIKLNDTLHPNTTYSFNFGDAITDNNEGNVLPQFKYIFSTGSYIDSLKLEGTIQSAHQLKTDNFVNVMLYDATTFKDSTVYKEKPLYITNTLDSLTTFSIENIKAGTYYAVALKQKTNNYMFNPDQDKIAFIQDTIVIPTDKKYNLVLFKSEEKFGAKRPAQISENKWYLPYKGNKEGVIVKVSKNDSLVPSIYTPLIGKDSLQLWFPKVIADSLHIAVSKEDYSETFTVRPRVKMKEIDTLSITAKNNNIDFNENFSLKSTTPIATVNKNLIQIINKDSLPVSFEVEEILTEQKIELRFEKNQEELYRIQLLPQALTDFFGYTNDTLSYALKTTKHTDYGNLNLTLASVKRYPIIVELIDEQEKIYATQIIKEPQVVNFNLLPPRKYYVRIIYDDNQNGKWDTGYYWDKRQPEETFYSDEPIDVRANWDINQDLDVLAIPKEKPAINQTIKPGKQPGRR
ncbi:Ig-like domain-containing protein [Myroides sp. DW712]|uniref:Ig-like domain-containing protein n=1 Tax=Myroides sp. DW712 TaxID=3389800 RepID=UPI00397E6435